MSTHYPLILIGGTIIQMPVGDQVSDSARLEGYTWDNPAPIGTSSQNGGSFSSLYVMSGLLGVSLAVTLAPSLVDAMADSPFVLGTTTGTLSLKAYNATQVQVSAISGATRYITLAGSVAGNPVIGTSAGGLEIALGGANAAAFTYVAGTTSWITFQGSSTGHNYIQSGGVTSKLWINPSGNILLAPGGAGGWGRIEVGGAVGVTYFYGSTNTYFGANLAGGVTLLVAGAAEQMRIGATGIITMGGAAGAEAARVTPVASQTRYVNLTGATATTNPSIGIGGTAGGLLALPQTIILPKTTTTGIQVDTDAPSWGWRDLTADIQVRSAGASDPTFDVYGATTLRAFSFSATAEQEVFFVFHVPHDWVPGTAIYFHAHWSNGAVTPNTGNVMWGFDYTFAKGFNQANFPALTTITVLQACPASRYRHNIAETAAVSTTGLEVDSLILVRGYRKAADGSDTCTDAVFLHTMGVHYQSTNMATKAKAPSFYT